MEGRLLSYLESGMGGEECWQSRRIGKHELVPTRQGKERRSAKLERQEAKEGKNTGAGQLP